MKILFLHGWTSVPGGRKPTYLKDAGHEVLNPALPDEDFDEAVRIAQAEYDEHQPNVVVGSSRGGAVAVNIDSHDTPLVLLCPAWKKWGTATKVKANTTILHSRQDDVVPFENSIELVRTSGLPESALVEVGNDHRLADEEPLAKMLRACIEACEPEWTDNRNELLEQEWGGLCFRAALRWIMVSNDSDWVVVHGTIMSKKGGKRIGHAWCERDNNVVDLTMPVGSRIIEREKYYRVREPEISKRYSSEDALILLNKKDHNGPWDESEQLSE